MTPNQYKSLTNAGYDLAAINRVPRRKRRSWRAWLAFALAVCAWLTHTLYDAASAEQEFRDSIAQSGATQ